MAKYRPISPANAWRSTRSAELDITDRYGELYLLSSPFSNPIGCYRIVERIASAEIGLSIEQMLNMFSRLQDRGIAVYEGGFVLVRTWFFHNTWESALQGNVAKMAMRDVAELPPDLREKWAAACMDAGVPEHIIQPFVSKPLMSPLAGAPNPLPNKNYNNEPELKHGTTTEPGTSENQKSSGSDIVEIHLSPIAEPHRAFIESTVQGMLAEDAQKIADEVSGALEAVQKGQREPIRGLHGWLPKIVECQRCGTFVPQWGPAVANRRDADLRSRQQLVEEARNREIETQRLEEEKLVIVALLQKLTEVELEEFSDIAGQHVPVRDLRPRIKSAILRREIPPGLGGAAVLAAAKDWGSRVGANG